MTATPMINCALLTGKSIEFTARIEDLEGYPEAGMRAVIQSIHVDNDTYPCCHITVSYSAFDEYNKKFESSNYYDKNQNPCLTAREAGHYTLEEELVIDANEDIYTFFTLLNKESIDFIREKFAESKQENYVAWLEQQFLLAHGKTM